MTNTTPNSEFPKYLNNKPFGEDQLEGRSHEKIASNISKIIFEESPHNKIIGLDGAWGSGKSNVIEIIKRKLEKSHELFNYDAWGHQEDLKRRSFLEELIEFLCEKGLLDAAKWNQNLKDLLAKKRETVTKTVPTLSNGIVVVILLTVLSPMAKIVSQELCNPWKILVAGLPFFIAICAYFLISYKRGRFLRFADIFYLYKQKELENTTHVTISEKEPSVKEFQEWMDSLSNDLKGKKLVVVFDNMDRLPPEKVKELWSSIHTFFSEETFPNIWVIVPFDRQHVQEAFNSDELKSNHFINKTFSVIFRVTPPVLSDWKNFFRLKFVEAFGTETRNDYDMVRNVFDILQNEITPRNIIAFLNELVSLRIITDEDVKSRYLALFILTKHKLLSDQVNQILNLEFLGDAKEIFKNDADLQDSIAAVVYGVPLDSASQVTLTRDIEISLRDAQTKRLNEIADHPHFTDVLEQVINAQEISIENTIRALNAIEIYKGELSDRLDLQVKSIWRTLLSKRLGIQVSQQKFSDFDKILLSRIEEDETYTLMKYLLNGYASVHENFNGEEYYQAINELKAHIDSIDETISVNAYLKSIEVPPEQFISFVNEITEDDIDSFEEFGISSDAVDLNQYVIDSIDDGNTKKCIPIVKIGDYYDFTELLSKIKELISDGKIRLENVESIFTIYKGLANDKPITILPDQLIQSLLNSVQENTEGYYDLVAMRIARAHHFPNQGGKAQNVISNTNDDLPSKIAKRIEYFESYGDLLLNSLSWSSNLLQSSLQNLTKNSYGVSRMDISKVLARYNEIVKTLELEHEAFLNRLNGWVKYAKENISHENITDVITDSEFFEYAIEVDNELTKYCLTEMSLYFEKLDVQSWAEILEDEDSFLFKTLNWILAGNLFKALPDNLVAAYKGVLIDYANGEYAFESEAVWERIYSRINKNKLKPTFKNIRDIFISDRKITPNQFIYLLPYLKSHGALDKRSNDVVRKILAEVASNDECLSKIIEQSDFFVPIIKSAKDDAYDFKDIIRQKLEAGTKIEGLVSFAEELKIDAIEED